MADASEEPTVASLTSWLCRSLYEDLITDIAIEEHRLAWKRRYRSSLARPAQHTANGSLLAPPSGHGVSQGSSASSASSSRPSSPALGQSSTTKKDKDDAASALMDCLNCGRQIAAPRYAQHLSQCMGLTGGRARGRAAANGGQNPMTKPPIIGVASLGPGSDRGSSYASDEETMRRNGSKLNNGLKRSASSAANGSSKPKKARANPTAPLVNPQVAQVASHPLSKTYSAPPAIPRPVPIPTQPIASASSAQMAARASLPGPAGHPGAASSPQKAPRPPPPASVPQSSFIDLSNDRPDSDSEDSDDTSAAKAKVQHSAPQKSTRKAPPPASHKKMHPLARVADSESGSDSDSNSGSD